MMPGMEWACGTRLAAPRVAMSATERLPARVVLGLGACAFVAAAAHSWTHRYGLANLDAVSYLDTADAWRVAGWRTAMNGYWSPLYSWTLAAAMAVVRPSRALEYVLLHAVNLVLFVASIAACARLVRELLRDGADDGRDATITWSPRQLATLAIVLWTWMALTQMVVWMESPDLLVAIATFAAAAMLVRLRRSMRAADGFLLGIALGFGYLAKAAMLPLSLVYLAAAAATARRRWTQLAFAVLGLALVAGPWIAALSVVKGRPTTGDVGRLSYIWFVGHSRDYPHLWPKHWPRPDALGSAGTARYEDLRLHDTPAVYDLSAHGGFDATYPPWHDPSRYYEGVSAAPTLRDQLRRLRISAGVVFEILTVNYRRPEWVNPEVPVLAIILACWLAAAPGRRWRAHWHLVAPAVATIGLYSLVYVSPRYLGAAIFVLLLGVIAGVRMPAQEHSVRLLRAAATVTTTFIVMAVVAITILECAGGWIRLLRGEQDEYNVPWHIAEVVHAAGMGEGAPVAIVGNAQVASRWARLARVKIVAEVPPSDLVSFAASADAAAAAVDAFTRTKARFVLAEKIPAAMDGWRALEGTPYWVRELPPR